ncbi:MAG: YdcF family protein [Gammaproteobacteria bacterium]|nr:YdcF family protein [Gammaproteobacteria bacterium]
MALIYLLKTLVLPPGGNFLCMLIGLLARRRRHRLGSGLMVFGTVSLLLCCLPITGLLLLKPIERVAVIDAATLASVGAIVILSADRWRDAPEYGGDTVDDQSLHRVRYGARLARASGLPILVSGGVVLGDPRPALADLMATTLREDYGITPRWIERQSRNTAENARFSAQLLLANGISRVAIVTDAIHQRRALQAFQHYGLVAVPAPTRVFAAPAGGTVLQDWLPSAYGLRLSHYALHEHLGRIYYRLRYAM